MAVTDNVVETQMQFAVRASHETVINNAIVAID